MITLMEHNLETYDKMSSLLNSSKNCAVVQATGTGKSFLALKFIEDYISKKNNSVAIIVPTNILGDYWRAKFEKYFGISPMILTYQLLSYGQTDIPASVEFLIIDELHRAGAIKWGKSVGTLLNSFQGKILGLTATPIRSMDSNRDIAYECFGENIVKGITLQEAVVSGVLPNFDYVTSLFHIDRKLDSTKNWMDKTKISQKEKKVYNRILDKIRFDSTSVNSIKEIISRHLDLSKSQKVIVFATDFYQKALLDTYLQEWFEGAEIYDLDYTQSLTESREVISNFEVASDGLHILKVIDKLNEGVHVSGVTALIMLRKTESNVVYFQQLGRALSASTSEKPVVFDIVNNCKEIRNSSGILDFIGFINSKTPAEGNSIVVSDYAQPVIDIINSIEFRLNCNWTEAEDAILKIYYPDEGGSVSRRLPNRDSLSCRNRAQKLGLSCGRVIWTADMISFMKENYPSKGPRYCAENLKISLISAKNKAKILELIYRDVIWTDEETERFINLFKKFGTSAYSMIAGRTEKAVAAKAADLGLICSRNWTDAEVQELISLFNAYGREGLHKHSSRTFESCLSKAKKLHLSFRERKNLVKS